MRQRTSAILLAGGTGSRMQREMPKQFLPLGDKAVVRHSMDLLASMDEIDEIIIVCDPAYRHSFTTHPFPKTLRFAIPGARRQDSLYNGMREANPDYELILVHDAARPFIDRAMVRRVLEAGMEHGAATVGMPVRFTVKESGPGDFVAATHERSKIWEIQTPQVVRRTILDEGFRKAIENRITVTDDVSLAELCGYRVKLVEGSYANLKITVPEDLQFANFLVAEQKL